MKKKVTKKNSSANQVKAKQPASKNSSAKMNGKSGETDIIDLILRDHKPIKELIEILKGDAEFSEKQEAFEEFAPTLLSHAEPEEESLYARMKDEDELREEAFEGDVEHALATQLIEDLKASADGDEDLWMAKVKVLAELVEHHIEEEEEEVLKNVRKEFDADTRMEIGQEYLTLRKAFSADSEEMPAERSKKSSEVRAH